MIYYIKECETEKILGKFLCLIKTKDTNIELPINLFKLYDKNKKTKLLNIYIDILIKKIKRIVKENPVILSKCIKNNMIFIEELEKNDIQIYDGKWLYRYILKEIMEYIIKEKGEIKENSEISFLVNYFDDVTIENIKMFAKEYKRINIVTNHIEKLKKIEEDLYNENGIMITASNNKRKSLVKSKYIINVDFPDELVNKYNIYDNAIIINLEHKIKIHKKRFNGIIINDYEINTKNIVNDNIYSQKDILESLIFRKDNFYRIRREIEKSNFFIINFFGNNGVVRINKK